MKLGARVTLAAVAGIAGMIASAMVGTNAHAEETNYHLIGWFNAAVPGAGQIALGNTGRGLGQAGYEMGSFSGGALLSQGTTFSLDGFTSTLPTRNLPRGQSVGVERYLAGDMLQEFGIKAHMINTFDAYRIAAAKDGFDEPVDQRPIGALFKDPFQVENLSSPWVYAPMSGVFAYVMFDFFYLSRYTTPRISRLNPSSNALYTMNLGVWQPFGSGAPEEAFYRGFLQTEFKHWSGSSPVAIAMSSALFSLSHAPNGRVGAVIAGSYLGFLADRSGGSLAPGITLHFWADMFLGVESILLSHRAQRTTPPTGMSLQVDF